MSREVKDSMMDWDKYREGFKTASFSDLLKIVIHTHGSTDSSYSLCRGYAYDELDRRWGLLQAARKGTP